MAHQAYNALGEALLYMVFLFLYLEILHKFYQGQTNPGWDMICVCDALLNFVSVKRGCVNKAEGEGFPGVDVSYL